MDRRSNKRRKITYSTPTIQSFSPNNTPQTLHQCAKGSHTKLMQKLIKDNSQNINDYDEKGYTALHYALHAKQTIAVATLLLENGADPNVQTLEEKQTLLSLAALHNKPKLTKLLVKYKADQNLKDKDKKTALYIACERHHFQVANALLSLSMDASNILHTLARANKTFEITRLLAEKKVTDIHAYDHKGYTALHYAVYVKRATSILKVFLKAGANPNIKTRLEQLSLLHLAARANKKNVVELLLEYHANCNIKDRLDQTPLYLACEQDYPQIVSILLSHGAHPGDHATNGGTPLYGAVRNHNLNILKMLLEHNADIDAQDAFPIMYMQGTWGKTILHWAIYYGDLDVVKFLLKYQPNIYKKDNAGKMAIHEAAEAGSLEMIEALVANGAQIDTQTSKGASVLHILAQQKNPITLAHFINYFKPNIYLLDKAGANALHYAATNCKIPSGFSANQDAQIVQLLCQKGLSLESRTFEGLTPLHIAVLNANEPMFTALLEQGAQLEALGCNAWNILHYATINPRAFSILKKVIAKGLDIESRTYANETPLQIAISKGNIKAIELLLYHGASLYTLNNKGETPFQVAAATHGPLTRLLYELNSIINLKREVTKTLRHSPSEALENYATWILQRLNKNELSTVIESLEAKANLSTKEDVLPTLSNYAQRLLKTFHKERLRLLEYNPHQKTALHFAIDHNEIQAARFLLDQGANLYARDRKGCTSFHRAIRKYVPEMVEFLYAFNGLITLREALLETLETITLHTSQAVIDYAKSLLQLLKKNKLSEAFNSLETAADNLHQKEGPSRLIGNYAQKLLEIVEAHNQDLLSYRTCQGETALHTAVSHCSIHIIHFLLNRGANIDAIDQKGETAFQKAIAMNAPQEVLELLYQFNSLAALKEEIPKPLESPSQEILQELIDYKALLLNHLKANDLSKILALLQEKADNLYQKHGTSRLISIYARQLLQTVHTKNKALLEHRNRYGDTALLIAGYNGTPFTIQWLFAKGADPYVVNLLCDSTILHIAARFNHPAIIEFFHEKGVDIAQRNAAGHTPLQIAAAKRNYPALMWLLDRTNDKNTQSDPYTVAHIISSDAPPMAMKMLADKGVKVDTQNDQGNTTLHIAAASGNLPTVEWLMNNFAGLDQVENHQVKTPLEAAIDAHDQAFKGCYKSRRQIIALLWIHKNGGYYQSYGVDQEPDLADISDKAEKRMLLEVTQTLIISGINKAILRKGLAAKEALSAPSNLFSEAPPIEAALRLKRIEKIQLFIVTKYLKLPCEIRMMIAHHVWENIKSDPENRQRMQEYPPITTQVVKPFELYQCLEVMQEHRNAFRI